MASTKGRTSPLHLPAFDELPMRVKAIKYVENVGLLISTPSLTYGYATIGRKLFKTF